MANKMPHWVFGYGSLIWKPGFPFIAQQKAVLGGAHRSLSVFSQRHRGTAVRPGLVFGLVPGGSCRGMGFEIDPNQWEMVHAYLEEREMDNGVYRETVRPIRLADGSRVMALSFMVNTDHPQYAGRLDLAEQVRLVRGAIGESGPNPEYVRETALRLKALGIPDRRLDAMIAALDAADADDLEVMVKSA